MFEPTIHSRPGAPAAVWDDVTTACLRIPPLWNLRDYVAVNPFLGFAGVPAAEAARVIGDGLGAAVLPGLGYYRDRWAKNGFGPADLAAAARRAGHDPEHLRAVLDGGAGVPVRQAAPVLTFAERHDLAHGTDWNDAVIKSAARWCAVYATDGGRYWARPSEDRGLFRSWREAAAVDYSLDIAGLRGFRSRAARLPDEPAAAIAELLAALPVEPADRVGYFYRLLGGLYGWASYFRRAGWQSSPGDPGAVADVLAVRLCSDAAVFALAPERPANTPASFPRTVEDEAVRLVFQDAAEDGFVRRLLGKVRPAAGADAGAADTGAADRPAVQAVFCIDVRSEPFRRHLEATSAAVETRGFAGFFGVALNWREAGDSPRCPVLLSPGVTLSPAGPGPADPFGPALLRAQSAPPAAFSFVELLGLGYAVNLLADAVIARTSAPPRECCDPIALDPDGAGGGIRPDARADLAAGMLKNMGFTTSFARLVLLCGHAAETANNPHAAGLDCGACGGHGGGVNARVAAAILNDPAVRAALPARGWRISDDTHFLPAVHMTTTDTVMLLDSGRVPTTHRPDLARLTDQLTRAGEAVRRERAGGLGIAGRSDARLARVLGRRGWDWSEVRPEWGLARNAAFVAARRARTRGADLGGRAFLHEYDAAADPDGTVLTLIMTAPLVVASWINLQYFASTVDNRTFGAGDKALHNRVGALGVVLGNGGDLRTGLALQSVHAADGSWYHEPLRLQAVIEAPPGKIDQVLAAQPGVKDLVDNGWVRLFALSPESSETHFRVPGAGWERVDLAAAEK